MVCPGSSLHELYLAPCIQSERRVLTRQVVSQSQGFLEHAKSCSTIMATSFLLRGHLGTLCLASQARALRLIFPKKTTKRLTTEKCDNGEV